ncbi:MAG: hypothetical protein JST70_10375 [Bacteroidetes bacterium]|nr:hypothetical protein [Bacteroidota bacterium]
MERHKKKCSRYKFVIALLLITNMFKGYSQTKIEQRFWDEVKFRRMLKVMPAGLNSWLYSIAQGASGTSYTDALARLESIDKDKELQNAILIEAYCNNYSNKESLRFVLANLCGSYAIANPVSDIVVTKYSANKKVQSIIRQRKLDYQKEQQIKAEKNAAAEKQAENEAKQRLALEEQQKVQKKREEYEEELKWRASSIRSCWVNHLSKNDTSLPKYKGGLGAWDQNIKENVVELAQQKGIDTVGEIIIGFTIDSKGDVSNVGVKKGLGTQLDDLAVKCVKNSSDYWRPAKIGTYIPKAVNFEMLYTIWYQPAH